MFAKGLTVLSSKVVMEGFTVLSREVVFAPNFTVLICYQ